MKKMFFLAVVACISMAANAQLENTKWKGAMLFPRQDSTMAPASVNVTWDFGKDSAWLIYDNMPMDSADIMTYTYKAGIISFQKAGGSVPCDASAVGKYRINKKDGGIKFSLISDDCKTRAAVAMLNKDAVFMKAP